MGNASILETGSIIDTATMLLGSKPQPSGKPPSNVHQLAMARRLEQLEAALGNDEPPPKIPAGTPTTTVRRGFGAGSLVVTAIVSALAGSTAMALTLRQEAPRPAAASVPVPVAETVRPVAAIAAAVPAISDARQIEARVEAWRSAWARRDVAAYLAVYSPDFKLADGGSHDAWVAARTKKLAAGAPIALTISQLTLKPIDGEHFQATFLQDYAAGAYRESARPKTLLFARQDDEWRITGEWQQAKPGK